MLRLGDDRTVRGHHQPGRLRLADPHPARPRHIGRLRPAEVREREGARLGAAEDGSPLAGRGPPVSFPTASDKQALERGTVLAPRFDANGLVAAVAQHAETGEILMLAWM